jgi:hypothetical protein
VRLRPPTEYPVQVRGREKIVQVAVYPLGLWKIRLSWAGWGEESDIGFGRLQDRILW